MTPAELRAWRARCGLTSWQAVADALGLSRRMVYRYLDGEWPIPLTVELACRGLEAPVMARPGRDAGHVAGCADSGPSGMAKPGSR